MYNIRRLFNPEIFQGKNKNKNYFEGWYFKLVDKDNKNSFALIPGIAYDQEGRGHSFIQIIDSIGYNTEYFKFDVLDFKFSENSFDVSIANNEFNNKGLNVNLNNSNASVKGSLEFLDITEFPKTLTRPGIMGPFSFVPFMECYHGVVNINHKLKGKLNINGKIIDFTDGHGYIEKDWGQSFPKWYVWMQSNNFKTKNASLMFSVAKIPWLKRHFTGFLTFLSLNEKMYILSTYTGAKIKKLQYTNGNIHIIIKDRKYLLEIIGTYDESGILKAPKNGLMKRLISESISSTINVKLTNNKGEVLFNETGKNAGLEVVGKHIQI